ncbi:MAG: hypothetical protein EPO24_06670 [Bacteroidetes bacterium]|nr:MAG: hypothetical protein EPO24_06670 [Bacteroidota bacterium]
MDEILDILESLKLFYKNFGIFLVRLLAGFLLLIIGWVIADSIRKIALKIFKLLRIDNIAEKVGIEDFLLLGGVQYTTVTLLARTVYWFIMVSVILATLNVLGLQSTTDIFNKLVFYIPTFIAAMLILIFGIFLAKFVQAALTTYLNTIGMSNGGVLGALAKYMVIIFIGFIALEQLSIGGSILVSAFQIAFGAVCFGFALAFGMGGKEWAAKFLDSIFKKDSK